MVASLLLSSCGARQAPSQSGQPLELPMPKTSNSRGLNFMRLEAEHAPPAEGADVPDLIAQIRYFPTEEIAAIIESITVRVAKGKAVTLKPDTAYMVVKALRAWDAKPSRESTVREICGVRGGCKPRCLGCIGKAYAIMGLYEGRKVR